MKAEPERRLTLPVSSVSTEIHKLDIFTLRLQLISATLNLNKYFLINFLGKRIFSEIY